MILYNHYIFCYRSAFRLGIVQGDKPVIYPILQYLLEQGPELKKRAYLARFLVKLDIPGDVLIDSEVAENHQLVTIYFQMAFDKKNTFATNFTIICF